jgi:hypothetical protein
MSNLEIWERVERSDPDFVKSVPYGGFKFSAIDAQSQLKRATEVFGPCGLGWGTRNERFNMIAVDPNDPHANMLVYQAEFFYTHNGQPGSFDIASDIELYERVKGEWKRVNDPVKKCRTDAVTKALSWLGFNSDVFLGKFDDQKYVQQLKQEKQVDVQRQNALATEQQQKSIQELAAQASLAGADFAAWLREKHNTSWSRLTAATADKVIDALTELVGKGAA